MSDGAKFSTVTSAAKTSGKNAVMYAQQKALLGNAPIASAIIRQVWPDEAESAAAASAGVLAKDGVKSAVIDMPTLLVAKENLLTVMGHLRATDEFSYDFLLDLTAIDFHHSPRAADLEENAGKRFRVVYLLRSMRPERRSATLRVGVPVGESEEVPSITSLWPGADWPEREVFDLMGIRFSGHPNLRRIVLPDNYRGHPLRKDFPVKGIGEDYLIEDLLYKRRNVD